MTIPDIKLLIADSRVIFQIGIASMLANVDHIKIVATCTSGNEAINKAIKFKPDIVLLDINIIECNCFELVKRLRELLPNIHIILITPLKIEPEGFSAFINLDIEGYLMEDIDSLHLINTINAVYEGKRSVSQAVGLNFLTAYNALRKKDTASVQLKLTKREIELLSYVAKGLTNREISKKMFITINTVKVHLSTLMKKMSVSNRHRAVLVAQDKGILNKIDLDRS